ncbi:HNH endonuclease [Cupriavidus basilensis]|uniref:HNH endonuclease n=1 Tax=Cupriavidus basilensis TaxID=68895 RepID=A0ABT6AWY8_9BURK|nr:HNH endonuclease [Cupriavidus basilensis]MDF3837140.1 HNH endonuclease [Cupriavidus basilensis]
MPPASLRPCRHRGCKALVRGGGYCEAHKAESSNWSKGEARKGSTTARGYGYRWQRLREFILARDCGICQCEECKALGRVRIATEVDHRVPKAEGGTDDPENLRAINADCHKAKTGREGRRGQVGRRG